MNHQQTIAQVFAAIDGLELRLRQTLLPVFSPEIQEDWDEKALLIDTLQWNDLSQRAFSKILQLEQDYAVLETEQAYLNRLFQDLNNVESYFKAQYNAQQQQQFFTDFQQSLSQSSANPQDVQELSDKAKVWERCSADQLYQLLERNLVGVTELLDHAQEIILSKIAYQYVSYLAATMNMPSATYTGNPNNLCTYYRNALESKWNGLRSSSMLHSTLDGFEVYLRDKIEQRFLPSLQHQLNIHTGTFGEKRTISKLSDLLLEGITDYFGVRWLKWQEAWADVCPQKRAVLRAIRQKTVAPIPFQGVQRSIHTLLNQLQTYSGREVIAEGIWGNYSTLTLSPTKVVSRATLTHPISGRAIGVLLPYFRLDATGIEPSTYSKLSGILHPAHPENNQQPTIVVDRLSMSDWASVNLQAWVRLKTRYIIEKRPHNIALQYAFQRGQESLASLVKYDVVQQLKKNFKPKQII